MELMEALEYSMLMENEQRAQWLIKNSGHKLEGRYRADVKAGHVPANVRSEIEGPDYQSQEIDDPEEWGRKVQRSLVEYIMAADPTPNKVYTLWIAMRYLKPNHNAEDPDRPFPPEPIEDINPNLYQTLEVFARAANSRRINGDINQYKSFSDLFAAVEPFITGEREVSGKQDRKNKRDTKVDVKVEKQWENDPMLKEATVIYDSDNYMILQPKTSDAAKYFGKNTNWCTTTTQFDFYNNLGKLWIILRRKDGVRWQFHFERAEFMTEQDRAIDINEWMDENPEAVKAIGLKRFAALLGNRSSRGMRVPMSARHFSQKVINSLDPETLVRTISSAKDIEKLPRDKVDTKEFCSALLLQFGNTFQFEYDENDLKRIIAHYTKLFPDAKWWYSRCKDNNWLLNKLPEKYQTDEIKIELTSNWHTKYHYIEQFIPKPWPQQVEQKYWVERVQEDKHLRASDIPEAYRDDAVLVNTLARNPTDLPNWEEKMTETLASAIVEQGVRDAGKDRWKDDWTYHNVERIIEYMPEQFLTKKVQLPLYRKAMDLKAQKDEQKRDSLLRCLAKFPHSMWPWKAATLSHRMGLIHDDFSKLPKEMHYSHHAVQWARHNPFELHTIPAELITEKVVQSALEGGTTPPDEMRTNRYGEATHRKDKGKPYELSTLIQKVKRVLDEVGGPEGQEVQLMDLPVDVVEQAIINVPLALKGWRGIPEKFRTDKVIAAAIEKGFISLGDEHFPLDQYTPENVTAYFKQGVPKKVKDFEMRGGYRYDKGEIDNVGGMKTAWEAMPEQAQSQDNLAALMKAGYGALLRVVPKERLDAQILTGFVEGAEQYRPEPRELFKLFPEDAYTTANIAAAVKKGIIEKAPEHLQDDEVLMSLMKQHNGKKSVDWTKITPQLFIKFLDRHPYEAGSLLNYNTVTPKTHPLYSDPDVAMAMLTHKPKKGEYGYVSSFDTVSSDTLRGIYGSIPARRAKWTEAHYASAAGNIVQLKDIPEKFRSTRVIQRALETNPDDISQVKNPIAFLTDHATKEMNGSTSIRMLSKGIVNAKNGWVDASKLSHKKVEGAKGSYVIVNLHPGKAMCLFDEKGQPLDAIVTYDSVSDKEHGTYSYAPRDAKMWSSAYGPMAKDQFNNTHRSDNNNTTDWKSYRRLLGRALHTNPEFCKKLPTDHKGLGGLTGLHIYTHEHGKDGKTVACVEDFERQTVEGTDLTYCTPDSSRWGGTKYFFFDGTSKSIMALVVLESAGGWREGASARTSLESVSLGNAPMNRLLELAAGFTKFFRDQGLNSGTGPKFKESVFFEKLGIRGPGKGEWWCYLAEKVSTVGDLTVWRNHDRVAITDNEHGVIATGKVTKAGIKIDSAKEGIEQRAEQVFNAVKGKL